jgi:hypothetical protein
MAKKKVTEEAHAYTPGLKIKKNTIAKKLRKLPIPGEVFFTVGSHTSFESIVAKTMVPGDPHIVKAADLLEVMPADLPHYMKKKVGDTVSKGEILANYSAFFGLLKKSVESPIEGLVESVSNVTGQVIIRDSAIPVEVKAYIPGTVIEVLPQTGVVIETYAAFIQGIFGIGGETWGKIVIRAKTPDEILSVDKIDHECKGNIVVGGSLITLDALNKAVKTGVTGVVVGGIIDTDLIEFLGHEIGVAITGHEELGLTLIITEGFGKIAMSDRAFNLLKTLEGKEAAINGATQIRAGVLRPEIIIPIPEGLEAKEAAEELSSGMKAGTPVRIIREPYFGEIAIVVSLPVELQKVESESHVRVVEVQLDNGDKVIVPRANVEILEV